MKPIQLRYFRARKLSISRSKNKLYQYSTNGCSLQRSCSFSATKHTPFASSVKSNSYNLIDLWLNLFILRVDGFLDIQEVEVEVSIFVFSLKLK